MVLVLLSVFVWSLCCLSFDVRVLNIPLVSVTSSMHTDEEYMKLFVVILSDFVIFH
jgi:hypothetical protein